MAMNNPQHRKRFVFLLRRKYRRPTTRAGQFNLGKPTTELCRGERRSTAGGGQEERGDDNQPLAHLMRTFNEFGQRVNDRDWNIGDRVDRPCAGSAVMLRL